MISPTPGAEPRPAARAHRRHTATYRVVSRAADRRRPVGGEPIAYLQYAKPRTNPEHTVKEIRLFLTGGVLAGTLLALIAGLAIARRAMRPIASLTRAAKEIARTRDPAVASCPSPTPTTRSPTWPARSRRC